MILKIVEDITVAFNENPANNYTSNNKIKLIKIKRRKKRLNDKEVEANSQFKLVIKVKKKYDLILNRHKKRESGSVPCKFVHPFPSSKDNLGLKVCPKYCHSDTKNPFTQNVFVIKFAQHILTIFSTLTCSWSLKFD